MRRLWCSIALIVLGMPAAHAADTPAAEPELTRDVMPLLKAHCVKCHGPAKSEGKLNLSTAQGLARGGESGSLISAAEPAASLIWQRVADDEMPPDEPLSAAEKAILEGWLRAGAKGLPAVAEGDDANEHWAFRRLERVAPPAVRDTGRVRNSVDRYLLAGLEARGLSFNPEADRETLIRRVSFALTGLPPKPAEIRAYLDDPTTDAYEKMVERYLASPHYGERWGKYWLDAAGYADSNGYFNADSDRPLAYRYRDYVTRALNADKPFDRFVLEQLAGDELSGFVPGQPTTPDVISLLEATHYLRNGQDGSGESDGNEEEVRIDRYSALEATTQIVASSLLGLTLQCSKCHDHKFEPISQRDYYQLQAVFYPAYDIKNWLKPNERVVFANLPGEMEAWEERDKQAQTQTAALKSEFAAWVRANRPPSVVLFHDEFASGGPALSENWSNTAPGDDVPGGTPAVELDSAAAPGALRQQDTLQILESGAAGDRWISTKQSFDWTPDETGQWIQVTFDLVDNKVSAERNAAERISYFIGLHDYNDNAPGPRGNILIDGNPAGGASVHVDYPGADDKPAGDLGNGKYEPGHNFGVRVTNIGDGKFKLEHLVDGLLDDRQLKLDANDLSDGGFGFEYCCGRSFVVDNVVVERRADGTAERDPSKEHEQLFDAKRKELAAALKAADDARGEKPGKIAWTTDRSENAPDVFLLERGNTGSPGEKVEPMKLTALADGAAALEINPPFPGAKSTGRRLAWARWLTEPGSRPAALVARVQANRLWQHHFGRGIVVTAENLGTSGAPASHPELLEYLAAELVDGGWSMKSLHRLLLTSSAYRQTSALNEQAFKVDPNNQLWWRHNLERLDAEAIRDAVLAVSGQLDDRMGGPYVPTTRDELGEVLVSSSQPGVLRRSLYLQQRRTQTLSFLNVFDSPTIVFNCIQRPASTMPLQSLSLLNSDFTVTQARRFAERLEREAAAAPADRVSLAYVLAMARQPNEAEKQAALGFVEAQRQHYADQGDAETRAWADFCQMLLSSNSFMYVE